MGSLCIVRANFALVLIEAVFHRLGWLLYPAADEKTEENNKIRGGW